MNALAALPLATATPGWAEADGPGVSFVPVTYYLGPWEYLRRRRRIRADVRGVVGPSDAVILRVGRRSPPAWSRSYAEGGGPTAWRLSAIRTTSLRQGRSCIRCARFSAGLTHHFFLGFLGFSWKI